MELHDLFIRLLTSQRVLLYPACHFILVTASGCSIFMEGVMIYEQLICPPEASLAPGDSGHAPNSSGVSDASVAG